MWHCGLLMPGVFLGMVASCSFAEDWTPRRAALMTRWAKDVSPATAHQEHPRPQLVRDSWLNLNGLWDYAVHPLEESRGAEPSIPTTWDGKILVPFPIESALSGVMKKVGTKKRLWYRRTVEIPDAWRKGRVLLHFGAVDWHAQVWLGGKRVGEHKGGYDPFTFDVTDALAAPNSSWPRQDLVVAVWDPTDAHWQPRGKQVDRPRGIWYTSVTGIWQTVWLESVPKSYVSRLQTVPDVDSQRVRVTVETKGAGGKLNALVHVLDGERTIVSRHGDIDRPIDLPLANAKLWSPSSPFLYRLKVDLRDGDKVVDTAASYFGMRKISLGKDKSGTVRLLLNNQPLFQYGPLDQGWWPDGLYTAPTDEALRYDIEVAKKVGFNMIRKHVKVEPARWYYWCDKLGMLVWQDMPNGDRHAPWNPRGGHNGEEIRRSKPSTDNFNTELAAMVDSLRNHPSIVMWVPFNEAWGQFDTVRVTKWIKKYDPTRLVNCASGGNDFPVGDVYDIHRYPGPAAPQPDGKRAIVLGEFGGLGLPLEGHTWLDKGNWGYRSFKSPQLLTSAYLGLLARLRPLIRSPGLAAAIYTQTSDVEIEVNGLMTYDRAVIKMPAERIAAANRKLYLPPPLVKTIVADAQRKSVTWRYVTSKPAESWFKSDFDDSTWREGPAGFGRRDTPGSAVRTEWTGKDIWIRREFKLPQEKFPLVNLHLRMHHDEDAQVYLNGVLATEVRGYETDYSLFPIREEAQKSLRTGINVIAVHCRQTGGGQYIDVGLVDVVDR